MLVEVVETLRRLDRRLDVDLRSAYEKVLRLNEFSYPLSPQGERPFVATTGQPMNQVPPEIYAFSNETLAASKAPPPVTGQAMRRQMEEVIPSSQDEDQES